MPDKKKLQEDLQALEADLAAPEVQPAPPAAPVAAQTPAGGLPAAAPPAADPLGRTPEDLARGYARPRRDAAVHAACGQLVILRKDEAEMFARSPGVLGTLRCPHCRNEKRPVREFKWQKGGQVVGT
jgi:hypothetical protein